MPTITCNSEISQGKSIHPARSWGSQLCGGREVKVVALVEAGWSSWASVGLHVQEVVTGNDAHVVLSQVLDSRADVSCSFQHNSVCMWGFF